MVNDIKEEDNAVFCTLYDSDKMLAHNRVFTLDNFPADLATDEKELVKGKEPTDKWKTKTIKLWLHSKQIKDEDGEVSKADQYYYPSDALKADLLEIVKPKETL